MNISCFLMMQFNGPHQDEFFHKVQDSINRFNDTTEHNIELNRADLTPPLDIENLEDHLKKHIEFTDFAIAEISQLNPNVLFEMGYAIGIRKPVIIAVQKGVRVPADFGGRLYFEYDVDEMSLIPQKLQGYLKGAIESLVAKRYQSNYLINAFSNRVLSDLSQHFMSAKERVDILTTNLHSLVTAGHLVNIREQLKKENNLRVRILTLDPESDFAAHRARQVGISTRHFRDQLRDSLEKASETLMEFPEECRIMTYNEFPTQIAFRIDDLIYFQVVSATQQSRNNILLIFSETNAGVAESILSHFDTVWGRGTTVHRR